MRTWNDWVFLILKNILLYVALMFGSAFVLLPLFWMLLTAFKEPGTALKNEFFPRAVDVTVSSTLKPGETAGVTQEYKFIRAAPGAKSVTVAGSFNGWDKNAWPMQKQGGDMFQLAARVAPGRHGYKYVVDGEWMQGADLSLDIPESPDHSAYDGGKIVFRYAAPASIGVEARMDGQAVKLAKNDRGEWTGEAPAATGADGTVTYAFAVRTSLIQGLKSIYTLKNFRVLTVSEDFPFVKFFVNSLIVALASAFLTVILCGLAAYVFAVKRFYGKEKVYWLLLMVMMVPGMIFFVPQFALVNLIGKFPIFGTTLQELNIFGINTYAAMVVPHLANVFGIFLLKQSIETIPQSLFEAARMDGANEIHEIRHIVMPIAKPIMITLFLMTFLGQWNNFLWQLVVNTPDSALRTLPVGLKLFQGQYAVQWEQMMAGACFSVVPVAFLFILMQRYFIEGMTQGAVKG